MSVQMGKNKCQKKTICIHAPGAVPIIESICKKKKRVYLQRKIADVFRAPPRALKGQKKHAPGAVPIIESICVHLFCACLWCLCVVFVWCVCVCFGMVCV